MKKIAIIPARSSSKGLPNKNILNLCGKPLIAWTIEAAIKSNCFDKVIVSTDSKEYGKISMDYGAEVVYRSKETASDIASTYDALKELFEKIDTKMFDYFVVLQPTSPLRTEKHIVEAVELFENNYENKETLVSVVETHQTSNLIKQIDETLSLKNFNLDYSKYSRQKYKEYESNGAIFISKINHYLKAKHFFGKRGIAYIMDKESSVDIDDKIDFELAIILQNKRLNKELLRKKILERIDEKQEVFRNTENEDNTISLIGHSQLDNWDIDYINDHKVINYGIRGISSFEYNDYILSKNKLQCFSNIYIVMHGTNDILNNYSNQEIYESILCTIDYIKEQRNNAQILFLSCIHVNGRIDRDNKRIDELNSYLYSKLNEKVYWVDTKFLDDEFENLDRKYTIDGLHLNEDGYQILKDKLEKILQDI